MGPKFLLMQKSGSLLILFNSKSIKKVGPKHEHHNETASEIYSLISEKIHCLHVKYLAWST